MRGVVLCKDGGCLGDEKPGGQKKGRDILISGQWCMAVVQVSAHIQCVHFTQFSTCLVICLTESIVIGPKSSWAI